MSKELSWRPRHLDGGIYCAPACGGRCKLTDYDKAIKNSVKMVKGLREFGWEPDVWENLGWHYGLKKGRNTIRPPYSHSVSDCYMAFIYLGGQQFVANGKTPKRALGEAIRIAQRMASDIQGEVASLII